MHETIPEKDLRILKTIEEHIFSGISRGIDLSELNILDDVNAGKGKIEELGAKIAVKNPELAVTILEIARSVYFSHSTQAEVPDFFDAVMRLGADRVKLLFFSLSLFALGKGPEARLRAAKSASIGILGRTIAEQMNLKDELVRKVETGGLLSQLGKNALLKARELGMDLSDDFIEKHEKDLALIIMDRLDLDPFLKKAIGLSVIEFDEESLSLPGIIKLAEAMTEDSFRRYGKLVLKSPMPDSSDIVTRSPGDSIRKLFTALGVEEFLEVQETPTRRQLEARGKQKKGPVGTVRG